MGLIVSDGVGRNEWIDPNKLRFSQRTISSNNYRELMEAGKWKWSMDDPLIVIERENGILVSLDNRRLNSAILSKQEKVPGRVLKSTDSYIDYKTYRTAEEAFQYRARHRKTMANGGVIPSDGLAELPRIID